MGDKDSAWKMLFSLKDIMADLLNIMPFNKGRLIFKSEWLEPYPTEKNNLFQDKLRKLFRITRFMDHVYVAKAYDTKEQRMVRMLTCIEFQSSNDSNMLLRFIQYIILLCLSWLSGLDKSEEQLIPPPMAILIYSGEKKFNMKRFFSDLLSHTPDFLKKHILQFEMFVVDVNNLPPIFSKNSCTELNFILHCCSFSKNPRRFWDYFNKNRPEQLSLAGAYVIQSHLNFNFEIPENTTEEKIDMCKAVDYMHQKCWKEGYRIGRKEGLKEGRQLGKQLAKQLDMQQDIQQGINDHLLATFGTALSMGMSQQDIQTLLKLSKSEYSRIMTQHFSN